MRKLSNQAAAKLAHLAERDVALQIRTLMERLGWRFFRQQVFSGRREGSKSWVAIGEKGMPDQRYEYYLTPGFTLTLYVETKRVGRDLDPDQILWHATAAAQGALVIKADNIDTFMDWYEETFGWLRTETRGRVEGALMRIAGQEEQQR